MCPFRRTTAASSSLISLTPRMSKSLRGLGGFVGLLGTVPSPFLPIAPLTEPLLPLPWAVPASTPAPLGPASVLTLRRRSPTFADDSLLDAVGEALSPEPRLRLSAASCAAEIGGPFVAEASEGECIAETGVDTVLVVVVMRNLFGVGATGAVVAAEVEAVETVGAARAIVSDALVGFDLRGTDGEAERFACDPAEDASDAPVAAAPVAAAVFFAGGGRKSSFSRSRFAPEVEGAVVSATFSFAFSRFGGSVDESEALRPFDLDAAGGSASCMLTSPLASTPVSTARSLPLPLDALEVADVTGGALGASAVLLLLLSFAAAGFAGSGAGVFAFRDDAGSAEDALSSFDGFFLAFFAGGSAVESSATAAPAFALPFPLALLSAGAGNTDGVDSFEAGTEAAAGGADAGAGGGVGGGTYLGSGGSGSVGGIGYPTMRGTGSGGSLRYLASASRYKRAFCKRRIK